MSPVIYRPGGGGPEEPERPERVSIAPPNVPTAGDVANGSGPRDRLQQLVRDMEEDPDIPDEELDAEERDQLVEETVAAPPPPPKKRKRRRFGRRLIEEFTGVKSEAEPASTQQPEPDPEPILEREPAPRPPGQLDPLPTSWTGANQTPEVRRPDLTDVLFAPAESSEPEPVVSDLEEAPLDSGDLGLEADHPDQLTEPPVSSDPEDHYTPPQPQYSPVPSAADTAPPTAGELAREDSAEEAPAAQPAVDSAWQSAAPRVGAVRETTTTGTALTGRVRSTRNRGLSGITVNAIDDSGNVIASTTTVRHGEFELDDLPDGEYRVVAADEVDGDFGSTEIATVRTRIGSQPRLKLQLQSAVAIIVEVDSEPDRAELDLYVTERSTGHPCVGEVTAITDAFTSTLTLVHGRAQLTVPGDPSDGEGGRPKRVKLAFAGDEHGASVSRTVRLR